MLYHALQAPAGSGVDVQQISMTLIEALDPATWVQAFRYVSGRHPTLRTRLRWEGVDEPVQEVLAAVEIPVREADWRDLDAQALHDSLLDEAATEREAGFDLTRAPLMRLFIARVGDEAWSVLWTFHHLILDGRAFAGVIREVFEVYAALRQHHSPDTVPGRPFADYVRQLQGMDAAAAETFWRHTLAGFRHPTRLPLQAPDTRSLDARPDGPRQGARQCRLPLDTSRALRGRASALGVGVGTLVHAAWALLLHRYADATDVVFGTTRSCAHLLPVDGTDARGVFINTVPLRIAVTPESSVADWIATVRQTQLDMRPFEWAPLARIQTWSESDRSLPLFDSLVVYDHESLGQRLKHAGGVWNRRHFDYVGQTGFPLTLVAYGDDEMLLRIEYDRGRFLDAAVERMLGHLGTILEGLCDERHAHVRDVPWLTADEYAALTAASPTAAPYPRGPLLHRWFESQVKVAPHAPAVTATDAQGRRVELSYAQLNERANRLAYQLRARGVRPNQLVGLRTERHVELVIGLLAILKAGGAYLPLDPVYPKDRVAFMLQDSAVDLVLTQASLRADLAMLPVQTLCIDDASAAHFSDAQDLEPVNGPDDLAYVIYTSGSTGTPKGVRISHHNVCRLFSATHRWYGFDERDVWTLFHSYAFDFSVWELWGAFLYGGRLVVVDQALSRDAEAFRDLLVRERVTVLNQTPTAFRRLVDLCTQGEALPLSLRYVIFGGEALELQMLRPWFDRYGDRRPALVNMYGITETTVHVTYRPVTRADLDAGLGSVIGVPIPDLRVMLVDSRLQPVPVGVPGEMLVAGAGVSIGYLHRPELTDQRFIPDPFSADPSARLYRSGDLARRLESGELEYLGRIDHQVKIRGFRIELGEIESRLAQHPAVRQCAVVAREDVAGDKRLVAYLVLASDAPNVIDECRSRLRDAVPDYMVPAHFVRLPELPLTANGKLDQRALPRPVEGVVERAAQTAPRTPWETELVAIWKSVLRIEQVGIHDHFMDLGGDSILSIQVLARCRQRGMPFTLKDLYERPTIAELVRDLPGDRPVPAPAVQPQAAAPQAPDAARAAPVASLHAGGASVAPVGTSAVTALAPIQHWFFEQGFADPHHWNQAFLFACAGDVPAPVLETAWSALVAAHPALRTAYRMRDGGEVLVVDADEAPALTAIDLGHVSDADLRAAIEERCAEAQAGLDPTRGPLARAVHMACGAGRGARLLLVVHHLAVDGVSWRILVEDFEAAVQAAQRGQRPVLPAASATPVEWAAALTRHTRTSPDILQSLPYWRSVAQARSWSLPVLETARAPGRPAVATVSLDAAQTRVLLARLPARHGTQITAALLSALLRALRVWTSASPLRIDLEGHGRDPIDEPIDVARTVGWFTSLYPVALTLDPASDATAAVLAVDRQLQQVPHKGRSYGLLRYLSDDLQVQRSVAGVTPAPVLFNYLGQFDAVVAGSSWLRFAGESAGPWRSSRAHRTHPLEVIAWVRDGALEVQWHHDAEALLPEAVDRVAQAMRRALRDLVATVDEPAVPDARLVGAQAVSLPLPAPADMAAGDAPTFDSAAANAARAGQTDAARPSDADGRTPASAVAGPEGHDALWVDLNLDTATAPAADTDVHATTTHASDNEPGCARQEAPADAPDQASGAAFHEVPTAEPATQPAGACTPAPVSEPYALTPMQRLFFAMDTARPELGLEQWHFELTGPLDVRAFQRAWRSVIERHDVLHSAFTADTQGRPVQQPLPIADIGWTEQDWRQLPGDDIPHHLQRYLQTDRESRLPLDRAPVMRMALLRTADETWQFLWTTHHLVIDGWSWPLVLGEVSQAYEALLDGAATHTQQPQQDALPYRRYVEWVSGATAGSADFWRAQLAGVQAPTPVSRSRSVMSPTAGYQPPGEYRLELPPALSTAIVDQARRWRVTPGTLFHAAWALLLGHAASQPCVVFGTAFSGRPPELDGVESMIGPCVNDVPLRVDLREDQTGEAWVRALHARQIDVAQHQYLPLDEIQQVSGIAWRHRLFDSLLVFQNYQGGERAQRIGPQVACAVRLAPEATNFPLTVTVAAGASWRLRFLFDRRIHAESDVQRVADECMLALRALSEQPGATVGEWLACLPQASRGSARGTPAAAHPTGRTAVLQPSAEEHGGHPVEPVLLAVWRELFGTDAIGLDDNFFDLGGHSLLLLRAHRLVEQRLQREVPLLALLQYPSVRSLARHLAGEDDTPSDAGAQLARDRAGKQRQALARQRQLSARRFPG